MRFVSRALTGLALAVVSLALIGFGARGFIACAPAVGPLIGVECVFGDGSADPRGRGRGGERGAGSALAIRIGVIEPATDPLETETLGEIRVGRDLELRAGAAGELIEIGEGVEDGALVREGALLFRVDPSRLEAEIADAAAALAEAEAESAEAERALAFSEAEYEAALEQRTLREKALDRQTGLEQRGFATEATLEEARLQFKEAERAVITRDSARVAADKRVQQSELAIARAEIVLREARRTLEDATTFAPFTGVIEAPSIELGKLVSTNEALGQLIDPRSLEVAFRLPDRVFGRLLDGSGALSPHPVEVTLSLGARQVVAQGRLARVGARSAPGEGGRLVYAALDLDAETAFRPGDLVPTRIVEPPLENAARIPASAVTLRRVAEAGGGDGETLAVTHGELLLIGEDDRLEPHLVTVLRREGPWIWVSGAPFGARAALERGPGLSAGVRVRAISGEGAPTSPRDKATGPEASADDPAERRG